MKSSLHNVANYLTLLRIGLIPFIFITFYIESAFARLLAAFLFVIACITDYLDGYIARNFNQESNFGRMLDPIADKLLISTTLLLLVGFGRLSKFSLLAAVIILSRELLVSGLREYLSTLKVYLPVNWLTKIKTAVQMAAIGLLLCVDSTSPLFLQILGEILLWAAALITLYTGWHYVKASLEYA